MKVLCNACEGAEARVMCCADEAALCWGCDERVHAANKLAGKHLRVPLVSSSSDAAAPSVPKCDICQESSGYFFCLEDRALLCRNCDITIHSANPYVSSHQRFLLTGVQVGLESTENPNLTPNPNPNSTTRLVEKPPPVPAVPLPAKSFERSSSLSGQISWESNFNDMTDTDWPVINAQQFTSDLANRSEPKRNSNSMVCNSFQTGREGGGMANKMSPGGGLFSGNMPDWPLDEFFGFREYNNGGFGFTEHGSSKADSGKLGSSSGSSLYRTNEEDMDADECLGQVPETSSWTVPEMTASGVHSQRGNSPFARAPSEFDNSVPDIEAETWGGVSGGSGRVKSRRMRY